MGQIVIFNHVNIISEPDQQGLNEFVHPGQKGLLFNKPKLIG